MDVYTYNSLDQLVLPTMLRVPSTPIVPLLWTVFASILEVFILCFAGWILARRGIIDKKTQKQLNRINVSLFTPSLLFSKVAFSLSPQKLKELYIIPIFFVVVTAVSAIVAWLLGHLFRLKRTQRNFAIAAAMFNNSNSLPIALMQSLVITVRGLKWGKDDNKDAMLGRALSYLVLYSTLGMMVRWSYGVHLLSQADDEAVPDIEHPPSGPEEDRDREQRARHLHRSSVTFNIPQPEEEEPGPRLIRDAVSESSTASILDLTATPYTPTQPLKGDVQPSPALKRPIPPNVRKNSGFFYSFPNTPTRSRVDLTSLAAQSRLGSPDEGLDHDHEQDLTGSETVNDNDDEWGGLPGGGAPPVTPPTASRFQSILRRTKNKLKKFWITFSDFMTVPMWAAVASLIVACIRPVQHALEDHMQPVKGSLIAAGNCSIPVTLVVLGAYFYTPPPEKKISDVPPTTIGGYLDSANANDSPNSNRTAMGSRRERDSRASEVSIASLRESLKDALRLRPFKKSKKAVQVNGDDGTKALRKGETKTVFVAIVARMLLTPAIILPGMVALAVFDIHRVMDDPVFVVSMVLLVSSPPALTLAQITQAASGDAFERLISKTIFWSYCILTPPLTIGYVVLGLLMSKLS